MIFSKYLRDTLFSKTQFYCHIHKVLLVLVNFSLFLNVVFFLHFITIHPLLSGDMFAPFRHFLLKYRNYICQYAVFLVNATNLLELILSGCLFLFYISSFGYFDSLLFFSLIIFIFINLVCFLLVGKLWEG